jgi:hypothetical protein
MRNQETIYSMWYGILQPLLILVGKWLIDVFSTSALSPPPPPPCARGHVFVLVTLVSQERLAFQYLKGPSATPFRDFSLNKILVTFRNVRGLPGTNSHLSRTVTCRATLLSERVLISRTLLQRQSFVVLWKMKSRIKIRRSRRHMRTFQVTASEGLIQIGQIPASNTQDKV